MKVEHVQVYLLDPDLLFYKILKNGKDLELSNTR